MNPLTLSSPPSDASPAPAAPFLRVEGLVKRYPNKPEAVLGGVSARFAPGEFVGILGLSGAGKSTFLRCLNRLIDPTAGRLWVPASCFVPEASGERDVATLRADELRLWRRQVGMIFQQFNLVKRLTVLDNVLSGSLAYQPLLPSLFRRFPASEKERALFNLERVGLLDQAYQRADTLSGGQQQRVAIARALMQRPRMILADEPVASLDPRLSATVLEILRQVAKEDGITVLVSLHVLDLARKYSDRLLGFADGRIVFDGPPEDLTEAAVGAVYAVKGTQE